MNRALRLGAFALLSGILALPCPGQAVEELLEPIRARHDVPALGACVLRGAEVAALGVVGVRVRGAEPPATADDLWHLGSCTKAMTATLCAIAVANGELAWDTTLARAFPDLAESMHEGWGRVTLSQLLQHRAGLPADVSSRSLWGTLYSFGGAPRAAREKVVRDELSRPPRSEAGARFCYSNVGYVVAGAMLERAADTSWEELARQRLFVPLGMTNAGFGPPGSPDDVDQPRGHRGDGSVVAPGRFADNPKALGPAGTVHASLRDWARFVALHLGMTAPAVVDADALARLHDGVARADGDAYALGWAVTRRPWADGPILTHTGSNTMWFCAVWAAPDARFAVLAVCNQGGEAAAMATDEACAALIGRFGPKVADGEPRGR